VTALPPAAYLILGSIREGGRSGYDIKAVADREIGFCWSVSCTSVYSALAQLSDLNYVRGVDAPNGQRSRKIYDITPAGEVALREWLLAEPSAHKLREEGLLKLFFADALGPSDAIDIAHSMRSDRMAMADRLRDVIADQAASLDSYQAIVLRGGIELNEWFADWCERLESTLREGSRSEGEVRVRQTCPALD
jgi:DNA-binding PadR family transcriptional regulator